MSAGWYSIQIEQGTTVRLSMRFAQDSSPRDFVGASARMQIRERRGGPVLVDLSSVAGGGIEIDEAEGRLIVLLSPEQTDTLPSTCRYDIVAVDSLGDVSRLVEGTISVSPAITRDEL